MYAILDSATMTLRVEGTKRPVTLKGDLLDYTRTLEHMEIKDLTILTKRSQLSKAIELAQIIYATIDDDFKHQRGPKFYLSITIKNSTTGTIYKTLPETPNDPSDDTIVASDGISTTVNA